MLKNAENEPMNRRKKMLIAIIGATIGVYFSFKYLLPLIIPFVVAYLIARAIIPVCQYLKNKFRIPKTLSGSIILIILIILLGIGLLYLLQTLVQQILMLARNIPIYQALIISSLEGLCSECDKIFGFTEGLVMEYLVISMEKMRETLSYNFMPFLTEHTFSIAGKILLALGVLVITIVSILLIIQEMDCIKKNFQESMFYKDIHKVTSKLSDAGVAYLKTQCILMTIIAVICVAGLMILKNEYALLIGIGIAIVDAFPVLGSGTILVPWAIIELASKNLYGAIILLGMFLLSQLVRQFLEPKLLGDRLGIKSIFTFMSMYVGINLFGFAGFLLGPLGLVIIKSIVEAATN